MRLHEPRWTAGWGSDQSRKVSKGTGKTSFPEVRQSIAFSVALSYFCPVALSKTFGGQRIRVKDMEVIFGYNHATWGKDHTRWRRDKPNVGIFGAPTFAAWLEDPDGMDKANEIYFARFTILNTISFNEFNSYVLKDRSDEWGDL